MAAAFADDARSRNEINPRPTKVFQPSLWAQIFNSFSLDNQVQERYAEAIEVMKEQVRSMVTNKEIKPKDKLILIDNLERLGLAYHFEQQIEDQIEQIFKLNDHEDGEHHLFTTALHFRLLRQHGYDAPCGVFEQFKDKESDTFRETINRDIEGLLSLYEASFVRYHGEDILEEAMVFTIHCLNHAKPELDSYLHEKVTRALKQPLHRGISRVEARYYISIYEKDKSRNELLLKLAKLDFNFVQNLNKKELSDLFKRWRGSGILSELPHVRDRVEEVSYFWALGLCSEPDSTFPRLAVADILIMITIMDDTYDYSTPEEQQILTDALQRWNTKEVDQILSNDHVKIMCKVFFSVYEEFDHELSRQGRPYAASYARETMKQLAMAYHKRAEWYRGVDDQMHTFQQHLSVGFIVSAISVLLSTIYMGMESASEEAFHWLVSKPKIVEATGLMGRYVNDVGTYEREHEAGQSPNAVDCYMIEHGVSKQEAFDKFLEFAEDAWMTLNKEWVVNLTNNSTTVAKHILEPVLRYARLAEVTYKHGGDGYTNPEKVMELDMIALLIEPVII